MTRDLHPAPPSLDEIADRRVDILTRQRLLNAEAQRLAVQPVFGTDVRSEDFGRLLGIR